MIINIALGIVLAVIILYAIPVVFGVIVAIIAAMFDSSPPSPSPPPTTCETCRHYVPGDPSLQLMEFQRPSICSHPDKRWRSYIKKPTCYCHLWQHRLTPEPQATPATPAPSEAHPPPKEGSGVRAAELFANTASTDRAARNWRIKQEAMEKERAEQQRQAEERAEQQREAEIERQSHENRIRGREITYDQYQEILQERARRAAELANNQK